METRNDDPEGEDLQARLTEVATSIAELQKMIQEKIGKMNGVMPSVCAYMCNGYSEILGRLATLEQERNSLKDRLGDPENEDL